ncbi:hypothetical protein, partial [Ruegeria faecimaris]|uniref:hypothetical protein n=1 Tax=Ruegeria faecimaris TaxID=686389 RepID=UPI0024921CC2
NAGTNVTITGDGSTATPYVITSTDTNTDQQNLTLTGNQLSIDNGNTVTLPTADGTETVVNAGTNVTITGDGSTATP